MTTLKSSTKTFVALIVAIVAALQSDAVMNFLTSTLAPIVAPHKGLAATVAGLIFICTLLHNPKVRAVLDEFGLEQEDESKSSAAGQSGFARLGLVLLVAIVAGVMLLGAWSCSSWERTTFQTLSASTKVVNCSTAAYNHDSAKVQLYCSDPSTTILQTSENRAVIDKARQVQTGAVYAFRDYWCLVHPSRPADPSLGIGPCSMLSSNEKPTTDQIQAAQQKVMIAMQGLPELVMQLKAIVGNTQSRSAFDAQLKAYIAAREEATPG